MWGKKCYQIPINTNRIWPEPSLKRPLVQWLLGKQNYNHFCGFGTSSSGRYQSLQKKFHNALRDRAALPHWLHFLNVMTSKQKQCAVSLVKQVISSFSVEEEGLAIIDQLAECCLCWLLAAVYIWGKPCYLHTASPSPHTPTSPYHLIKSALFIFPLFIAVKMWSAIKACMRTCERRGGAVLSKGG